jgi:hypothetical protein
VDGLELEVEVAVDLVEEADDVLTAEVVDVEEGLVEYGSAVVEDVLAVEVVEVEEGLVVDGSVEVDKVVTFVELDG